MRQYELSLDVTEEDLCQWTVQASMHPEHRKPHLTAMWVGDLRLRVARLIEARERSVTTIQTAMEILGAAQKFERLVTRRFEAEDRELLGEEIVPCAVSPEHPAGRKIVYSDWWTATRSINKYAFRLLLCHIIADVSGWLDGSESQFTGSGSKAAQIARQDIDSIIASIPYLCSWRAGASRGASSPCGRDDIASVEGITSLLVIWPLYLAGDSQFATREQKEYIQRRLGWIAENRGVKHASGVSKARLFYAPVVRVYDANILLCSICKMLASNGSPYSVTQQSPVTLCGRQVAGAQSCIHDICVYINIRQNTGKNRDWPP